MEGIHKAFETSIAWRKATRIDLHRSTVTAIWGLCLCTYQVHKILLLPALFLC